MRSAAARIRSRALHSLEYGDAARLACFEAAQRSLDLTQGPLTSTVKPVGCKPRKLKIWWPYLESW
jgi:hypothetical protein